MKLEILKMQDELRNLIDSHGNIIGSNEDIQSQELIALDLMKNFLGCAITKNDKLFILSELELYFGGLGDMAHDWYRRSFPEKYTDGKISRTSKETSKFQAMKGPIYYYNRLGGGKHKRCDIVIGDNGVAVSFLIRGVILEDFKTLISGPNNALKEIGLTDDDLGKEVQLKDMREQVFSQGYTIQPARMRVIGGVASGFEYKDNYSKRSWNLSLKKV